MWRQIGSVNELVRVVQRERLLWVEPLRDLTQQALGQRLRCLPAELFERVLNSLLPVLQARWQARQRPVPPVVAWAHGHYTAVLIADGSTLDVLLRKLGWWREAPVAPLAGRMMALLDLTTRLPRRVWYDADPAGHDTRFWSRLHTAIPAGALLIFHRAALARPKGAQPVVQTTGFQSAVQSADLQPTSFQLVVVELAGMT